MVPWSVISWITLFKSLSISTVYWYPCVYSLCLTGCLSLLFLLYQFVWDLLAAAVDLWFMGVSLSHNKTLSNEVKEGDLCVFNTVHTLYVCMCVSYKSAPMHMCALLERLWGHVSWMVKDQWWALKCWRCARSEWLRTERETETDRRTTQSHIWVHVWGVNVGNLQRSGVAL